MYLISNEFRQWFQHESSLSDPWMRDFQQRSLHDMRAKQKYVQINGPGSEFLTPDASHFLFDFQQTVQ
jgi:hypothetical protein